MAKPEWTYEQIRKHAYKWAVRYSQQSHRQYDVDELLNEAWLAIKDKDIEKRYLVRTCKRAMIDYMKSDDNARQRIRWGIGTCRLITPIKDPHDGLEAANEADMHRILVKGLKRQSKLLAWLKINDYSNRQAAKILGVSAWTVCQRLKLLMPILRSRARRLLKK